MAGRESAGGEPSVACAPPPPPAVGHAGPSRPCVRGKFLCVDGETLLVKGVTYGTFRPDDQGDEFPPSATVERDFADMAACGVNAVRTYTAPPARVLEAAARHGLWLVVGLGIERLVGHLNDRGGEALIEESVRRQAAACSGSPAILCYAVGNEIPASLVRWFGPRRIERTIGRVARIVRSEDPGALVTYANYPSTEYLQLPGLDLLAFNVYLEDPRRLDDYIARLHNLAGDRPLIMTELGLDAARNGEDAQARSVEAQVRTAFAGGCAGAFVYAWTDEWHRGGEDVEDWSFGLTRRDRSPKPALAAVRHAFADAPFGPDVAWPRVSVVVCSHNGAATLGECLDGLLEVQYADMEVIVVDDGSSDATASIAALYPFRLISTEPRGLSAARNRGLEAATGDIVAYIDDDARPDPHWLTYLAATFMATDHAGVGGPNIAPAGAPPVAQCVDNVPGGPTHVLLSDRVAEHIPGCNMAFRRARLEAIGGFDEQFKVAGDDVDVCWRLQEQGWTLGFSPAAVVFHRRRESVRGFLRQQRGYGRAEALLERKWPDKYTGAGDLTWHGRLYERRGGPQPRRASRGRVYYGPWGSGLFQQLHPARPPLLSALTQSPGWYLVIVVLGALAALGVLWAPLLMLGPMVVVALAAVAGHAALGAAYAIYPAAPHSRLARPRLRALTALLGVLGPYARLMGRLAEGLTPWRTHDAPTAWPRPRRTMLWTTHWRAPDEWLRAIEGIVRAQHVPVRRGGPYDRWDLEIRGGILGGARLRMGAEDHAGGAQLVRFRWWPRPALGGLAAAAALGAVAAAAAAAGQWAASAVLTAITLAVVLRGAHQSAVGCGVAARAAEAQRDGTRAG
ncbi:MAG TPA: glycosyltransferase [Solirubrobacteraceae bacterium]|nr:glycosyltransferase [Solirubrobacteraceae bacterium]